MRVNDNPGRRGFTIIELLIVIAIIGVLTALVVGVSTHVRLKTTEDNARAQLKTIQQAISAFRDAREEYPKMERRTDTSLNAAKFRSWSLYEQLRAEPRSREVLQSLPRETIVEYDGSFTDPPDMDELPMMFVDAFENVIDYSDREGIGGKPVVWSAGRNSDPDVKSDDLYGDR